MSGVLGMRGKGTHACREKVSVEGGAGLGDYSREAAGDAKGEAINLSVLEGWMGSELNTP